MGKVPRPLRARWGMLALTIALAAAAGPPPDAASDSGSAPAPAPRRYALAIASPGDGPATLGHAGADARRFLEAMQVAGGVAPGDAVLLFAGSGGDGRERLRAFRARLDAEARPGDELVIYASGYTTGARAPGFPADPLRGARAGASGHEAGNGSPGPRVDVEELRALVRSARVGRAALLVDGCCSPGEAGVRVEGVGPGRAALLATSPGAAAKESDLLESSVLTQRWLAGLRGAADASGDGRVTLAEVYWYSFAGAPGQAGGPPEDLEAEAARQAGDLVLSEPGRAGASLVLSVDAPSSWLISSPDGRFALSVEKRPGPASIALAPGTYLVQARIGPAAREAVVQVAAGRPRVLLEGEMRAVAVSSAPPPPAPLKLARGTLGASVARAWSSGGGPLLGADLRLQLALERRRHPWSVSLGLSWRRGRGELEPSLRHTEWELAMGGALRGDWVGIRWSAGLEAAASLLVETGDFDEPRPLVVAPALHALLAAEVPIWGPFFAFGLVRGGPSAAFGGAILQVRFTSRAVAGMGVAF